MNANLLGSNDPLESRMRETRQSGSVGGGPQANAAFLPQSVMLRYATNYREPQHQENRNPNTEQTGISTRNNLNPCS